MSVYGFMIVLLSVVHAQPMPMLPMEELGPFLPEPPITHPGTMAWVHDGYNTLGYVLTCSNAATNMVVRMPVTVKTNVVLFVEGKNHISVVATNEVNESLPATLVWVARLDRYHRLFAESSSSPLGPWTPVPLDTVTNAPGIAFLRTGITNWTKWTGEAVTP